MKKNKKNSLDWWYIGEKIFDLVFVCIVLYFLYSIYSLGSPLDYAIKGFKSEWWFKKYRQKWS